MKSSLQKLLIALTWLSILWPQLSTLHAQDTAFTYQGRLNDGASPANGNYDLRFTLYDSTNSPGTIIAGPATNFAVVVSNGLFTATLDFGAGAFPGSSRWLDISVRKNGGSFIPLSPRQPLTPTPYAIMASNASGLTSLVIKTNIFGAPNLVGGSSVNFISDSVIGGTIGGGGATNYSGAAYTNSVTGDFGTVGGGYQNNAGSFGTVSGGIGNGANYGATVGGGIGNHARGSEATTIGGGEQNTTGQAYSTVGGGFGNNAGGEYATISGGGDNTASGLYATVCGGLNNTASGTLGFAAGSQAQALHDSSFVWADDEGSPFASSAANQFSVRAAGGIRLAGDVQISGGAAYHNLSLSGGNAMGYLYGSYAAWGDGIHIGYNWYNDANGNGHISNQGGGTSRLTLGYSDIAMFVGAINSSPGQIRLEATTGGVNVYGTFNNLSDRNAKQDFKPVNSAEILERVARLPITEWSYKDDPATRHVGPVAQDFYSQFQIGTDERHIAPIDEGGVAFAAIQGLNEKLELKGRRSDGKIQRLETENAELKQRIEVLERIVRSLKSN